MNFRVSVCVRERRHEKTRYATAIIFNTVVLAGLVAILGTLPLMAQSPSYSDFSSTANLFLNGNAAQFNNVLRLNPATTGQVGAAWFGNLQPVSEGFSTTFKFQITPPTPVSDGSTPSFPADGLAFVIQNSAAGTRAIGQGGGAIGYGGTVPPNALTPGIGNSFAIEFDTFANGWDFVPNINAANHIAVQSCGTNANSPDHSATYTAGELTLPCNHAIATSPVTLADGKPHTVQIEYTPAMAAPPSCIESCGPTPATLQVTIDGKAVFNPPAHVDLSALLSLANPTDTTADSAYVGFTAATGALVENNDILSWTFTAHGSQTIILPAPANVFTTFNFGSYLYKVRPNQNIDNLAVTEVPTDPGTFNAGSDFPNATCIVYDHTGGKCEEFHAQCKGAACSNVSYDVVTSYDVPASAPPITNPGFLKATGLPCTPGITFDQNIITFFSQTRIDPTTKGGSRPSFSCFVAVQNVTYSPADVDLVNVASPKVITGANLTYLIPVVNFGPSTAQGINLTDTIPRGTTFVSSGLCSLTNGCSNNECSVSGGTVSCTVGSLDPFSLEVMVLVVNVTAAPGTIIKDTVTSTAFNPDPRPADNTSTATTLVVSKRSY